MLIHEVPRKRSLSGSRASRLPSTKFSSVPSSGKPPAAARDCLTQLPSQGRKFVDKLLKLRLLSRNSADQFLNNLKVAETQSFGAEQVSNALVQAGLLTRYQVERVLAGTSHGLVLGNYRVLERLGAGAMGVVFLGEHTLLRRRAAIKVMPVEDDCPASVPERFFKEMRVLAELQHPHIVQAFDAGEVPPAQPNFPGLIYLVMELVPGGDLEQYVVERGPLPIAQACEWIRQAAGGLQEAHDHHLIHRDVKPSNLLLTAQRQVKLADFGLVRQFGSRLTEPRILLGTLTFMAPEQSQDPTAVGAEADIYALGAALFWLLAAQAPYPSTKGVAAAIRQLQADPPRRLRTLRPDVPAELDNLVAGMLDRNPGRRPRSALAVMNALVPFSTVATAELLSCESGTTQRRGSGMHAQCNQSTSASPSRNTVGAGR